jgi:hypothetical protein
MAKMRELFWPYSSFDENPMELGNALILGTTGNLSMGSLR